ncbi:MAG: SlyX family protein [Deltaproteobacteria bacterium]|nr:SlyX family protein [Nannocystaceae bacterium]
MEERIVELEVRVAYQEKMLRDLDEVVSAYANRIDVLTRELEELRRRVESGGDAQDISDEPPPHY